MHALSFKLNHDVFFFVSWKFKEWRALIVHVMWDVLERYVPDEVIVNQRRLALE